MLQQNRNPNPDISKYAWQTFAKKVKPFLLEQSFFHCTYCDIFFENTDASEVEHYKPQNEYPELKFTWENLFAACSPCNKQKEKSYNQYINNALPIKPDEEQYDFFKYFEIEFLTGEIAANNELNRIEKQRAENTIKYLGLNKGNKPNSRKHVILEVEKYKILYPNVPYRFIIECF